YRKRKAEQNAKMMELYQEEGVNPASSCLPLVAQAPVFLALFSVLRGFDELRDAQFYWVTSDIAADASGAGLGALVSQSGWPGWVLIAAMVVSMFITQKQTMARTTAEGPAAQQQKIMLYVLPVFLAFISRTLPLGVIVYWVTTNIWQGVQQWIIFREGGLGTARGGSSSEDAPEDKGSGGGSSNGAAKEIPKSEKPVKGSGSSKNGGSGNGSRSRKGAPTRRGDGHVPKRRSS
ncbi:MAG: YidC/Oxa1 family membrane protein insertase, partial [Dehalococcoidia bacterium]